MPSHRTLVPASAFALCASLLLAGCGSSGIFPDTTSQGAALVLTGRVHGGQQPVVGSHVHVMQSAVSAYGAASSALMTANGTTILSDSIGPYVPTDASGNFSITGNYTCTSGRQVYLLATQGNPGLGANNASLGLMAGLGACPAIGNFLLTTPTVFIDEVSTVATAYALAGFFVDSTHLATDGSAGATAGINNAALNIAAISSITTGMAPTAITTGGGAVPQAEINLLANILATCINSNGSGCTTLFANAANGSTQPTDSATATINIAHSPGANVAALFNTASATGPFQPALTAAPNDYSITINFAPATALFATAGDIAIDASGNVWGPGPNKQSAVELSPQGANLKSIAYPAGGTNNGQYRPLNIFVSPAGTIWAANYQGAFAAPTANAFTAVADGGATWAGTELAFSFDTSGNAWSANNYPASFGELTPSGTLVAASTAGYAPPGFAPPNSSTFPSDVVGVAVDSANHIWGICNTCTSGSSGLAAEITNTGTAVSGPGGDHPASILYPSGLAIDSSDNAWISDYNTGFVTKYSSASVLLSGSGFPSTGAIGGLNSLAIDGASNVWIAGGNGSNPGVLFSLSNAGTLTSPAAGYQALSSTTFYYPGSIAIDGSGNIWALDFAGAIHQTLGIATPVVTPITPTALGQRP